MGERDTYRIFAIRYGHHERRSPENFLGGDSHDVDMPLDYFVWAIVGQTRTFVLDTGFDRSMAEKRGRHIVRDVEDGLAMVGIDHAHVSDVIISHLHYDHAGNNHLFPAATFHIQDAEMAFATGRCMCHALMRHPFEADDVTTMVRRLYDGRVAFHDRDSEIAPGITVHRTGGHSRGLQVVRVETERGAVVLGSDAAHFYANMDRDRPFPVLDSVFDALEGVKRMQALASSKDHIVPGHDPLVCRLYPKALPGVDDILRLDIDPAPR